MLSLILSTIAFVVASYFAKRYLDDLGLPKGATRSLSIFCFAAVISYAVAYLVDHLA